MLPVPVIKAYESAVSCDFIWHCVFRGHSHSLDEVQNVDSAILCLGTLI